MYHNFLNERQCAINHDRALKRQSSAIKLSANQQRSIAKVREKAHQRESHCAAVN
jgi:hypothetical protein